MSKYTILDKINTPSDLKLVPEGQLKELASELRTFLVDTLDVSGGHFASSLGATELTVALHYVFNTPYDNIVWDVGHQTYIHKILTGRKDKLITIKKDGGISGFPKRSESEYDTFGVGHSSTSISAALGMAIADRLQGKHSSSIAVIGDGAITGGMAFEALNHAGGIKEDILVILNDNEMSISDNVGGLSAHFSKIISGGFYNSIREKGKEVLKNIPPMFEFVKKIETQTKGMFVPANFFEDLGFYYVGPIDGHNVVELVKTLRILKDHKGPKLLHVITKKGKGYTKAESDPIKFHHVAPSFHSGDAQSKASKPTYSNIFGNWICQKAAKDKRLVGVTPAMKEGSDLIRFSQQYPNRYFDVAIAEQHAVTFAGGLACQGLKPVVAIYSTFLQRAYDQVIHDIALQDLDVLYAVDRAGLVGADGATHDGSFDISFMRCIPNHVIMTPSDENETYHMLELGYEYKGPAMVRYPRGAGIGAEITDNLDIKLGKAKLVKKGSRVAILNFGTLLPLANQLADKYHITVVDMRFVKPLDEQMINQICQNHNIVFTLEESSIAGGAGSAVNEYIFANDLSKNITVRNFGLKDEFLTHGTKDLLLDYSNLSFNKIAEVLEKLLSHKK
ncbi:1-deoxy-D-xylulose-5-phosphate synthase [Francisella philomiragia]|uniref:1-deoxy-D-xylulose-5-phosphate synthase n=1 Tax=Francisella philomiragia subsp. philomiragia (strain ATCC 25017 / CCUG 19701 / FSC 153 / O\|nr:1-deoxy-D-xylulose-5-phosphate synthase [Francisella philomiragia]B0U0B3.1 RecName: Full=1-deoxy-D-xylulose-5-phosphate synthase; AltName: Full=1-deoxyxylulose-5-phosphate synthase; Short=DXP synthase; Short=DXPS [Francisella philomiragia subsp. philomiragia ATCC 25017]AJI47139.1 1-deoxy-D-xylulose-5-phosphate synthase [Francisella philomiragia]AJI49347.1 1-deoxy-D-xylulose-5-phosphate synthase [Francisella philomiragia]MBK2021256.1 1-deoxy-D-xylulose-5-phosphate synthase [Francisella philom